MKVILPVTFVENSVIREHPLIYLAGPIKGGGGWHERCCREIARHIPHFFAVVPCRCHAGDALMQYRVEGRVDKFLHQTPWEHYYLNLAAQLSKTHQGCTIFWLPEESKDSPREDGSPYGRDTYGEIGRWGRNAAWHQARIVVGAQPGFPGLRVIRGNLNLDFDLTSGTEFPIYPTLEETAAAAAQWVKT
jgi:hypothetical protein